MTLFLASRSRPRTPSAASRFQARSPDADSDRMGALAVRWRDHARKDPQATHQARSTNDHSTRRPDGTIRRIDSRKALSGCGRTSQGRAHVVESLDAFGRLFRRTLCGRRVDHGAWDALGFARTFGAQPAGAKERAGQLCHWAFAGI